jgi:hypothetical protein
MPNSNDIDTIVCDAYNRMLKQSYKINTCESSALLLSDFFSSMLIEVLEELPAVQQAKWLNKIIAQQLPQVP